jgi:hypothetical protein
MDVTQSLAVIAKYRTDLHRTPIEGPMDSIATMQQQKNHLAHMLDRMEEMLDSSLFPVTNWDKFNRWLGFVQGVFWSLGERTLNDMREDNTRPGKKE